MAELGITQRCADVRGRKASFNSARKASEDGYILVAVIFMMALMVIAMTVAAPKIAQSIQRDREIETMHRGKQYARAVKMYYKQFNAYPPNVDALVKTNEIRFLRKKYIDPTTGKDEWKPVRYGMQKTQTLGFFGKPIGGPVGGAGLAGGTGLSGSSTGGGSGIGGVTFGSPTGSNGTSGSGGIFGSGNSTDTGNTAPSGGDGSNGQSGSTDSGSSGTNGSSGSGGTGTNGSTTGSGSTTGGSSSSFGNSSNGQTIGGVGIMGFSPMSPKQSILVYKKKNRYNEWEFLYDPLADQMMAGGIGGGNTGAIGTPAAGLNGVSPVGGGSGSTLFGGANSGGANSGIGNSGNSGNSNSNSGNSNSGNSNQGNSNSGNDPSGNSGNNNSGNGNNGNGNNGNGDGNNGNGNGDNGTNPTPDPSPPEQ